MTEALLEAYREDIRIRIEGPERLPSTPGIVNAHDVVPGVVYEDDQVTVEAFAVPHGVWEHAYGYKFTSADRTIVISGDTGPFDGLAEIATGADVLIHEAYGTGGFNQRSPVNQRYHGTFHTSGTKVGEIATAAGVGMVVLISPAPSLWGKPGGTGRGGARQLRRQGGLRARSGDLLVGAPQGTPHNGSPY